MTLTVFGIKNCDTVKKARAWLDAHGLNYAFHDYKAVGVDERRLRDWCARFGWDKVLNRAGTTFKKLPDAAKSDLDEDKAVALMLAQPSMIKRPVVERGELRLVGFNADAWREALAAG